MTQKLLYCKEAIALGIPSPTLELPDMPSRIWTLFSHRNPDIRPDLPFVPVHHQNAWLEDCGHDWNWRGGILRYSSMVTSGRVWLLLEYD
jgi:hypothetical protein